MRKVFIIKLYNGTSYSNRFVISVRDYDFDRAKELLGQVDLTGPEKLIRERIAEALKEFDFHIEEQETILGPMIGA